MEAIQLLNLAELRTGDIIFSTTNDPVSNAIKRMTRSKFSHASIYFREGIIIESNDDGVLPKSIEPMAISSGSQLLGLPYENWISIRVLRHPSYTEQEWAREIVKALSNDVGLDYPPPSALANAGTTTQRAFSYPLVKLYGFAQWLRNSEAVASRAWCSKLVGYVLAGGFGHSLTARQKAVLANASPQQLFDVAMAIGYGEVTGATAEAGKVDETVFRDRRAKYVPGQDATFTRWKDLSDRNRGRVLGESGHGILRALFKLMLFITVVIAAGAAWLAYRQWFAGPVWKEGSSVNELKSGITKDYVRNILGAPAYSMKIPQIKGDSAIQYDRYTDGKTAEVQVLYKDDQLAGFVLRNYSDTKLTRSFATGHQDWVFGKSRFRDSESDALETFQGQVGKSVCRMEQQYFGNAGGYQNYYMSYWLTNSNSAQADPRSMTPNALLVTNPDNLCAVPEGLDSKDEEIRSKACGEILRDLVCTYGEDFESIYNK